MSCANGSAIHASTIRTGARDERSTAPIGYLDTAAARRTRGPRAREGPNRRVAASAMSSP
jgi:hypothetical protein